MNRTIRFGMAMVACTVAMVGSLACAQQVDKNEMQMPPRMAGPLAVDELTSAPLQLIRSAGLGAPPTKVFKAIATHKNWMKWVPNTKLVQVEGKGANTRREWKQNGQTIRDRFVAFQSGKAIGYSIEPGNSYGLSNHLGVWELRPDGAGTALVWHQFFNHPNPGEVGAGMGSLMEAVLGKMVDEFGGRMYGSVSGLDPVRISAARVIDAPIEEVWQKAALEFGSVDRWSSVITHSTLSPGPSGRKVGSVRSCSIKGGGFNETITAFDESARTFSYSVDEGLPPFVAKGENTWTIEPADDGGVVLTMSFEADIHPDTPAAAIGMFKSQFAPLFDMGIEEFVHYAETGKAHPRAVASAKAAR